jgi:hypothetical protein
MLLEQGKGHHEVVFFIFAVAVWIRQREYIAESLNGVIKHCKISNSKHQITNKSQIPISNDQNRF